MLKKLIVGAAVLAVVGVAGFFALTGPNRLEAAAIAPDGSGDAARGETLFWAGGCTSCHAAAKSEGDARLRLGGGAPLVTQFGTFHAPNVSPDPVDGIGAWGLSDFANAMQRGVAPDGTHLYPAFPYTSYAHMTPGDIADLFAFMKTLPEVKGAAPENELSFPFNIRRGVGLWKLAFLDPSPIVTLGADASPEVQRGQYLVEGPGHCGECHTPRVYGGAGGLDRSMWLAGAPNPEGTGKVPNISPSDAGIGQWSQAEIADYFETGFTPDFDSVGGSMVAVQKNLAKLGPDDRKAIATYLKAIPPH